MGPLRIEVRSISSCFSGSSGCGGAVAGIYAFIGFRIWEIIDVWTGVPKYHSKQDYILNTLNINKKETSFHLVPIINENNNFGLGIAARF